MAPGTIAKLKDCPSYGLYPCLELAIQNEFASHQTEIKFLFMNEICTVISSIHVKRQITTDRIRCFDQHWSFVLTKSGIGWIKTNLLESVK